MSNNGTYIATLGKDPEALQLGGRDVIKLRVAEKAGSKKAETRWFTAIVGGPDVDTANRLEKGDTIALAGELVLRKWKPGKGKEKYKGEERFEDEMPFAKLLRVIKSEKFFSGTGAEPGEAGGEPEGTPTADAPAGDEDPLADL